MSNRVVFCLEQQELDDAARVLETKKIRRLLTSTSVMMRLASAAPQLPSDCTLMVAPALNWVKPTTSHSSATT